MTFDQSGAEWTEKKVLIKYTSYWIDSRYTNVAETLYNEAM